MKGTMKAARLHGVDKPIQVDEVPIPQIGPNDALVKVKAAYINGGVISMYHGWQAAGKLPITVFDEMAGVIEEVGESVVNFRKGDRVVIDPTLTCHRADCIYCGTDLSPYCPHSGLMGMRSTDTVSEYGRKIWEPYADGGFAEYVKAPATNLIPIPDNITFEIGARALEMGIGYRVAVKTQIMPGDTVIIDAATGNSGSCALKMLLLFNPSKIIAVARSENKLQVVKGWAPEIIETVCSEKGNVRDRVMEITKGRGADVLVDYSPPRSGRTFEQCLLALRKCGRAVFVGSNREPMQLPFNHFLTTGIVITGCRACSGRDLATALKLTGEGKLDWSGLITHRFPISKAHEMIETLDKRLGDPMWVLGLPEEK